MTLSSQFSLTISIKDACISLLFRVALSIRLLHLSYGFGTWELTDTQLLIKPGQLLSSVNSTMVTMSGSTSVLLRSLALQLVWPQDSLAR